ncbi:hypothetical protein A2697_02090 [Candidatus Curtissbacteria bacterium RIFCSPHIGHO2_01_FULL_41_44]|uniref:Uncharacterized protein n=1 Tax=Candidatus Curtissbacteria bacterium RIFCSPLOWO2_01_FULL_42_50 TaxID=1797730 RepID=A0A1F5H3M2_9BACT|nr:MAG: hypothetical protein A2697_02090 [Candidatus Curtissbacteria bacterium RIFCSPHIGHO2_01_FULL_41_44]OGD94649.1 MAG: hypothetical protein A3C33_01240 [Candidatus Curtissbacteria bacterium RIFCSPHIGHO2_02_FULL_42_58]OGD96845.1 MAG: hypothetical protein A3E71_03030 [Candidatus Curtissbacteria bacterium RIFCSPHIGHO2_12_FULL_42_33]OGD98733.1 MAG: hypothetical protein A3B54_04800 [Candidatus Curtissbacteria bacterium RIFCSPLOWO2_01_FULL_42_50]OGE02234.1 MAG: hypothetical protein A3G16_01105 [Ca
MNQKQLVNFLGFWVANTVVFLLASVIFGGNVVLGNDKLSGPMAAILSGLILTVAGALIAPAVEKSGFKKSLQGLDLANTFGLKIKDASWAGVFLIVNVVTIWVVKRLAIVTGLGISSVLWVLMLAALATLAQWGVAKATGAMPKK